MLQIKSHYKQTNKQPRKYWWKCDCFLVLFHAIELCIISRDDDNDNPEDDDEKCTLYNLYVYIIQIVWALCLCLCFCIRCSGLSYVYNVQCTSCFCTKCSLFTVYCALHSYAAYNIYKDWDGSISKVWEGWFHFYTMDIFCPSLSLFLFQTKLNWVSYLLIDIDRWIHTKYHIHIYTWIHYSLSTLYFILYILYIFYCLCSLDLYKRNFKSRVESFS